jgi:hypothetical protein
MADLLGASLPYQAGDAAAHGAGHGQPPPLALRRASVAHGLPEGYLDRTRARHRPALRAALERAQHRRRQDGQIAPQRQQAHAAAERAQSAGSRTRALGEQDHVRPPAHFLTKGRHELAVHAVAVHGDRVGQQGRDPLPPGVRQEVVLRAQDANAGDLPKREGRKQRQGVEVAGVIGHDQMAPKVPQLPGVVRAEAVEERQVRADEDVNDQPHRPQEGVAPRLACPRQAAVCGDLRRRW